MLRKWSRNMQRKLNEEHGRISLRNVVLASALLSSSVAVFVYVQEAFTPANHPAVQEIHQAVNEQEAKTVTDMSSVGKSPVVLIEMSAEDFSRDVKNDEVQPQAAVEHQSVRYQTTPSFAEQNEMPNRKESISPLVKEAAEPTAKNTVSITSVAEVAKAKPSTFSKAEVRKDSKPFIETQQASNPAPKQQEKEGERKQVELKKSKNDVGKRKAEETATDGVQEAAPSMVSIKASEAKVSERATLKQSGVSKDERVEKLSDPIREHGQPVGSQERQTEKPMHVKQPDKIDNGMKRTDIGYAEVKQRRVEEKVAVEEAKPQSVVKRRALVLRTENQPANLYAMDEARDGSHRVRLDPRMQQRLGFTQPRANEMQLIQSGAVKVFQAKEGQNTYCGTYTIEQDAQNSGLILQPRAEEQVQRASSKMAVALGTYMTIDLNGHFGCDFSVGFNGSELIIHPLDEAAATLVRETSNEGNRTILISSLLTAVNDLKVILPQVQNVVIYYR